MNKNKLLFIFFCLFIFGAPLVAKSAETNNLCTQKQCVKIQNGNLWVLSSDDTSYRPFFVKAAGYEPLAIGRYPSDWGYPPGDPRSSINNMYDDPNILTRDFSLLQQMNANAIRIWKGNQTTTGGRFPNFITNASNTNNPDKTQNTLDLAAGYGIKVIAGFEINSLTFDANNNVGSIDDLGNPLSRQTIINNFVNYVNTYKNNRAILFWVIGNENNYQMFAQSNISKTAFEGQLGIINGDAIYNWMHQNNYVHFNEGLIIDVTTTSFQNALQAELVSLGDNSQADYNLVLNYLIACFGRALTPAQLTAWFSLVNDMAQAAHNAEGANYHPVALVNGGIAEIGVAANGSLDSQMPNLDIWGTNIYTGQSFGTLFNDFKAKSAKPLWIAEFGVDAWAVTNGNGMNNWGDTAADDTASAGRYDPSTQAIWDMGLWNEISNNFPVTIGGSVMEYSDEWWKFYEWYCTSPSASAAANTNSSGICNSTHKYFGFPKTSAPDGYSNEEWYGIMGVSVNSTYGNPDVMSPRTVYYTLQTVWHSNPWPSLTLYGTGTGTGTITSSTSFGPGLNCNFASGSSTGTCTAGFNKSQPVTLSFTSSNNSTVTNWGVSGCVSGSATCTITPDTNITLNMTVTAPVSPTVDFNSYIYSFTAPAVVYMTANASEVGGGTISKVEFYNGSTLLSTVTAPQSGSSLYTFLWFNLTPGNYSLTAKAYDNLNNSTTSAVQNFTVNGLPTVSLTANTYAANAPASIVLTTNPSEAYGSISQVKFYNGSVLLGTSTASPYTFNWNNVPAGTYHLSASAIDASGNVANSTAITVVVNSGGLPAVSISGPANNSSYTLPVSIPLTASASSSNGPITNVSFFNGATLIGVGTGSGPYIFNWNNPTAGSYNITAVATDSTGAKSTSSVVSVTVNPHIAPTVSITSPTINASYVLPTSISLTANAAASNATISQVAFYNGSTLIGIATGSGPYVYNWSNATAGNYNLTAIATDSAGATTTSSPVPISVNSTLVPTVGLQSYIYSFTAPTVVYMTAQASEPGGSISKVEFYNGSTLVSTATLPQFGTNTYSFLWFNLTSGNYSLTAKAYDSNNHTATSAPQTFTVSAAPASRKTSTTTVKIPGAVISKKLL